MSFSVVTQGLRKAFGKHEVLRGLDLSIDSGSAYGLVGPNGAGKTTLFRILVGLSKATGGEVTVLDQAPGTHAVRQATGYMTQAEALYLDLSVEENVRFFGSIYGLRNDDLDKAIDEAIALVHLSERRDSKVAELSGGMRRRASLACAVVHRPKLLLLDEPTVGVDPELRSEFWDTFKAWAEQGTTLIVSTHHLDEASRCDRLGLLREGQLIAEGTPTELLERTGAATVEEAFLTFARRQA